MRSVRTNVMLAAIGTVLLGMALPAVAATGDLDENGFIDVRDYEYFEICLSISGPMVPPVFAECLTWFDFDEDCDVDLQDYVEFQSSSGHLPIPLRDGLGNILTAGSTAPYSGRQTCGGCHDVDHITNGFLFQQGRTDLYGNVIMRDDYYGDGRHWIKGPGRYGTWGQSFVYQLAAKHNTHGSQIEQTTFAWIRDCSGCHVGGGPGEYDRDGELLYDAATGQFGWEISGVDPSLDGDYALMDYSTGTISQAPWDVTGLSGPDCLYCHRSERTVLKRADTQSDVSEGFRGAGRADMHYVWRKGVLAAADKLVDDLGQSIPAFAAAATAGQGWFSNLDLSGDPPTLQIDYSVGVAEGSLETDATDQVSITPAALARPPKDQACLSCHPISVITGSVWFDERDVHFRKFNNLNDEHAYNDVPADESTACNYCHPGGLHHNFAKGNSPQVQFRNEIDWAGFRTCRDCHMPEISPGVPNPLKHPDAPDPETMIHFDSMTHGRMMQKLSCQACHIPYALAAGLVFRDITIPGATGTTSQYYSADPLDPTDEDKSRWYPSLVWKWDSDRVLRLFPASVWNNIYWGDWDQNGTPNDLSDDVISPILSWRINQVISPNPLPVVTDDNGDEQLEINRPEEIIAYIQALKGNDSYGVQVAANPVLVKGVRVWHEDPETPGQILSFDHRGTGIPMTYYPYIWELDHNVLTRDQAWGAIDGEWNCNHCHYADEAPSPVMDRLVLVDPYGPDGQPVYETVRQMTGINMPF